VLPDSSRPYDAVVIGGGFYGCSVALFLTRHLERVALLESEKDLLSRASYGNQARVHNGYHYPRSFLTALRSCLNFRRFASDFRDCVNSSFQKIYAVARQNSKVNSHQFLRFCKKIGAPITVAPQPIKKLFEPRLVEEVFSVQEYAFDADALRGILRKQLDAADAHVFCGVSVKKVTEDSSDRLLVHLNETESRLSARLVFNCTYAQINTILQQSGFPLLPMKHEIAEIILIEVPEELRTLGITVMDGPFFSTMPFPPLGLHSLSHVRYTPHEAWQDSVGYRNAYGVLASGVPHSKYRLMICDACRFVPLLRKSRYVRSLFEVKTVLMQNEMDDGRPILVREDYGLKNCFVIMGSKIDNIYDVLDALDRRKAFLGGIRNGRRLPSDRQ